MSKLRYKLRKGIFSLKVRAINLREWVKINPELSLTITTLVITLVYGAWGIHLSNENNSINARVYDLTQRMYELSKKQDTTSLDLQHFAQLLNKTDTVISRFNSQLDIALKEQKITNQNITNAHKSAEGRFYSATEQLKELVWWKNHPSPPQVQLSKWDSSERFTFLKEVEIVLKSQLDNPFLLSNKFMLQEWISVQDSISNYRNEAMFVLSWKDDPGGFDYGKNNSFEKIQNELDNKWRNCFLAFEYLSAHVNQYMAYYKFEKMKTHPGKFKLPNEDNYKAIMSDPHSKEMFW